MAYYERNLPHWQPEGKSLFVTWRLKDSLPVAVIDRLKKQRDVPRGRLFLAYDRHLDAGGYGPLWLGEERIANGVVEAIHAADEKRSCAVWAYVVMPNHVHLLLEPCIELSRIMKRLKGSTARAANLILGRTGENFWQDESFDHWIRNGFMERTIRYIEENPVKAGLAKSAAEWHWSSAARAKAQTKVCATRGGEACSA